MVIPFGRTQENIMQVTLLKSKLHRVTTTHAELDYEGSCAIDGHLLDTAGIREYEQIQIYNITNGERFTTYAIRAEDNSGIISVNGAAAHKANPQDLLIIATFASMSEAEADAFKPKLVYFDADNHITHTCNTIPVQMQQAK
jgi:aspartate 1-decarboxylase